MCCGDGAGQRLGRASPSQVTFDHRELGSGHYSLRKQIQENLLTGPPALLPPTICTLHYSFPWLRYLLISRVSGSWCKKHRECFSSHCRPVSCGPSQPAAVEAEGPSRCSHSAHQAGVSAQGHESRPHGRSVADSDAPS